METWQEQKPVRQISDVPENGGYVRDSAYYAGGQAMSGLDQEVNRKLREMVAV